MARRGPVDADHPAYDPGSCGPDGYAQCRRCLAELRAGQRDFCGPACAHDHRMRSSPAYARRAVYARDRGVCTHCRLDCGLLDRVLRHVLRFAGPDDPDAGRDLALELIARLGFGAQRRVLSLWQADHRLAVAEGGRDCGLGNFRTLCLLCHAAQTRALHARLKARSEG